MRMRRIQRQFTLLLLLLLLSYSIAFRPPPIAEELGTSPTLSELLGEESYFFDPLELGNDANFARFREAELKHGRIAMLAVLESMLVPILKRTTDWMPSDFPEGIWNSLKSNSIEDYVKVVLVCGFLETAVLVQKDPQDMPGDYGTGFFGVRDKGVNELRLVSELENGRLAMIAFAGQIAAELVTKGQSWEDQWITILRTWVQE